mgnify:CR=1 FL=1
MSGIIGKNSQAANQIALNLASMTYMVALGVGVAAMIRVGNQRGMMNFIKLREVALSTLLLIIIIDIFFLIRILSRLDLPTFTSPIIVIIPDFFELLVIVISYLR